MALAAPGTKAKKTKSGVVAASSKKKNPRRCDSTGGDLQHDQEPNDVIESLRVTQVRRKPWVRGAGRPEAVCRFRPVLS
jgi:hypothetical protein